MENERKTTEGCKNDCSSCFTSIAPSIRSRHCFMTGEHCSKQSTIQLERKKLYDENCITAFVIMNFSDMSDVFYKWRLRTFIESLTKYLYFDKKTKKIYCRVQEIDNNIPDESRIKEIRVIRSDSDPASNYVICSRICQQIQIADVIIVDVSSQNANVFYEFGMTVALGKMILPICYSESFYKMVIPKKCTEEKAKDQVSLERHIGCYPWRKDLFEYYGIRYKRYDKKEGDDYHTEYLSFDEAINTEYGFSDVKYNRFPYHEILMEYPSKKIGEVIYDKLKDEYNNATSDDNTLVVYTMDAFLNEEQAGRCIVNFYRGITARMRQEKCFCGERVGVLVQENVISESEKDSKEQMDIFYNVGEIIQIGVNQATYMAAEEKIKSSDVFKEYAISHMEDDIRPQEWQREDIDRFVKTHIKNRGMRIYPNNPVFVDRMKNLLHMELLDAAKPTGEQTDDYCDLKYFCLYHVMLRTLRYTNEIVVDISDNCLQSLFWLGAAHGSDIYAITVMHEKTDKENDVQLDKPQKENRYVFDVAGLWMAILRKNDTEGFYEQLVLAQNGIERHSKLMLPNSDFYKKQLQNYLFPFEKYHQDGKTISSIFNEKEKEEKRILESYYRDHFWAPMLAYNKLSIYISQNNGVDQDSHEPKLYTARWDFDAISALSYYLSKRKVIGEYVMSAQPLQQGAENDNFICIGSFSKTMLSKDIYQRIKHEPIYNIIHRRIELSLQMDCNGGSGGKFCFKGFRCEDGKSDGEEREFEGGMVTHQPKIINCTKCTKPSSNRITELKILCSKREVENYVCNLKDTSMHYEIAQLVLWREDPENVYDHSYFWVGIIGCSGPATYALSTLFVDQDQNLSCFKSNDIFGKNEEEKTFLCDLQSNVRKKFMEVFLEGLQNELNKINLKSEDQKELVLDQKIRYFGLVRYAVASYLRTILYKYFFPFLSERDMDCIYNGVYTFVNSMKASRVSPFALNYPRNADADFIGAISNEGVKQVVEMIPKVLLRVLKSFKGFEAFYVVKVKHHLDRQVGSEKDTREIDSIKMMNGAEGHMANINYFFVGIENFAK